MEQKNHALAEGKVSLADLKAEHYKIEQKAIHIQKDLKNPLIPEEIYENLPDFLKKSCELFSNTTDRDVFLVGALGVLSGCLPKVYGIYDNSKVSPNLFVFIVAKAAAGKGGMKWAKEFAVPIHRYLREQSKIDADKYKASLEEYEKDRNKRSSEGLEKPEVPANKMLFIPANSSSAVIIKALTENEGQGIIFDAEADTLSAALGQDWGNFSDLCLFQPKSTTDCRERAPLVDKWLGRFTKVKMNFGFGYFFVVFSWIRLSIQSDEVAA